MPVEMNPNPITDTGTGAYPNPPSEVTYESPADNTSTGAVEGPPSEVTVESKEAWEEPTGAAPNPPTEQTYYQWPATGPAETETKAVTGDEADVENKAVSSMTKAELQAYADANGIAVDQETMTKQEMLDTINKG